MKMGLHYVINVIQEVWLMRATGIVRQIDPLGRIVLPKDLRKNIEINTNDPIEFFVHGDNIVLQKYRDKCMFCASTENLVNYESRFICKNCLEHINKLK